MGDRDRQKLFSFTSNHRWPAQEALNCCSEVVGKWMAWGGVVEQGFAKSLSTLLAVASLMVHGQ